MKDQSAARNVLKIDTQLTDAVKQLRLVQGATTKDTIKISAPVRKSNATTTKQTPKPSQ